MAVTPLIWHLHRPSIFVAASVLLALALIAIGWPGTLTPDSQNQLEQVASGIVTDWHPPIMVRLWALMGGALGAMLILQVALHWLGIWSLAESLRRQGHDRGAWALVAVGCTPIALKYLPVIQKDTLLASFLVAAFGIATLIRSPMPSAVLGVLGTLCRANGVFALPPLFLVHAPRFVLTRAIAVSMASAIALIPVCDLVNHRLLGAQRTGVARSLQLFDLVGIAHYSGDDTALPAGTERAPRCYTPLFWDKLVQPGCSLSLDNLPPSLTGPWLSAIAAHPFAYARHRLAHFNRTIFLVVPPMQQCADAPSMHRCDFSSHGRIIDAVTKNVLLWPALWLAIGITLLFGPLTAPARALALSGVLYGSAYLLVGVASDFRYFYWTELAVQLAMVSSLGITADRSSWRRIISVAVLVSCIGYGARIVLA